MLLEFLETNGDFGTFFGRSLRSLRGIYNSIKDVWDKIKRFVSSLQNLEKKKKKTNLLS